MRRIFRRLAPLLVVAPLVLSCRQDMASQPRYNPLAESSFFGDERSARPLTEDTVARGHLRNRSLLFTGKIGGGFANAFPFPIDAENLQRGRQRYEIFCTPCHGRAGRGDGMIVKRGYRQPPSFHVDRLRQQPAGYFFDVITSGFGAMPDYAAQIPAEDRWRIVAYLRALQLSEHTELQDVPPEHRSELDGGAQP
jgi:mono/diheme cytochrome c family protein